MHFHSQNLNEHRGVTGSIWRNGRCWWHWNNIHKSGRSDRTIGLEWSFWKKRLSFAIGLADYDHALTANFCIGLFNLYFHYDNWNLYTWLRDRTKRKSQTYGSGRIIGFSWFDGLVHIKVWDDPMESRRDDPWWWHLSFFPKDKLLGKTEYTSTMLRKVRLEIPMPEGVYMATATFNKDSWARKRWWTKTLVRCEVVPDTPIPFPGKGESAWDCGEDAMHSSYFPAVEDHEAVSKVVESVLRSRYRHGGRNWRPEKVKV